MREVFKNDASSTLAATMNASQTTLTVTSAASFPTSGQFRVLVESELMLVTAVSGTTFTVIRGIEGTTAASHAALAITHIVTSGSLQRYGRDNDPRFDSSRPPFSIQDANGATLTSADFTGVNMGTTTVADQSGPIVATLPAINGESVVFFSRPAPATPYTVTACLDANCFGNGTAFQRYGIGFRHSADNKLWLPMFEASTSSGQSFILSKYTSPTVFNTAAVARAPWIAPAHWFRIEDDGTNLIASISHDGINWFQVFSEARTAFIVPDSVGWFAENYNSGNASMVATLCAWSGA